jgi:hypothetical protein
MTQGFIWNSQKKQRPKISCYCPFKILSITKQPGAKTIPNSKLLHGQKYAENCGSESLKLRTSEKIAIAELRSNISLKVAELRFRKCFLQVAELRLRTQNLQHLPVNRLLIYVYYRLPNPMPLFTGTNSAV